MLIIDVRTYDAYVEGHIPTAINIPTSDNLGHGHVETINSYNRTEKIFYCSCENGYDAMVVSQRLVDMGLENAYYMSDNFLYWPYEMVTGTNPGLIASSSYNSHNNNNPNSSIDPTIFLPINVALLIIGGGLILWRKRK